MVTYREGGVVEWRRRDQFAGRYRRCCDCRVDGCGGYGANEEIPVFWGVVSRELGWGKCSLRWRSMLMAVAKAEGLATVDPLLRVVVAFSVVRTEPVELIFCASEKAAVSSQAMHKESFMAKTREKNNVN